jgi:hypothetical protein
MNNTSFLENIVVFHDGGSSSPVPIRHRLTIHEDYGTPVLVIEEEPTRVIIEIRTETKEHYNQIFEQLLVALPTGVKGLAYNEWNPPPQCGRMIVDY